MSKLHLPEDLSPTGTIEQRLANIDAVLETAEEGLRREKRPTREGRPRGHVAQ